MGRKISDGLSVKVIVPAGTTVGQGTFCMLGGFFGMAIQTVIGTGKVVLDIEQCEYETSQITTADDFNAGDKVYFNATTKLLTTEAGTDNRPVGIVTEPKDGNNVIWFILGPQI